MNGTQRLSRAVNQTAIRRADAASRVVQLGAVVDATPVRVELFEGRHTLDDDELTLSQDVIAYDDADGIEVGDTAVLIKKETGGEIHWIVTDILSNTDPTPRVTEEDVDAKVTAAEGRMTVAINAAVSGKQDAATAATDAELAAGLALKAPTASPTFTGTATFGAIYAGNDSWINYSDGSNYLRGRTSFGGYLTADNGQNLRLAGGSAAPGRVELWDRASISDQHSFGAFPDPGSGGFYVRGTLQTRYRLQLFEQGGATVNRWNFDNNSGSLRIFRENYDGASGSVKLSITDAGVVDIPGHLAVGSATIPGYASTASPTFSGQMTFQSGFSTYTSDGVWHANARPSFLASPGGGVLRFGYQDNGMGAYVPSLGFGVDTAAGVSQLGLAVLQTRMDRGTGADTSNRFELTLGGRMAWGPGNAAVDASLERADVGILGVGASLRFGQSWPKASQQSFLEMRNATDGQDWAIFRPAGTRNLSFYSTTTGSVFTLNQDGTAAFAGVMNSGAHTATALHAYGTITAQAAGGGGFIQFVNGTTTTTGYIGWHRPSDGARLGYMGYNNGSISITPEIGPFEIFGNGLKVTGNVGFFGTTPIAKPVVSGSRVTDYTYGVGCDALDSLILALASLGLITNSTF